MKRILLILFIPALLFGQSKFTKNFNSLGHAYLNSTIEKTATSGTYISEADSGVFKVYMVRNGDEWNLGMYNALGVNVFNVDSTGNIIGKAFTGTGKISTLLTTEQFRLSYDAGNYLTATVADDGLANFVTVDPDGAEADICFNPDGNEG